MYIIEVWHQDRKVTVHDDCVMMIWGPHMDNDMLELPRTIHTVQEAFDWLYRVEGKDY